MNLSLSLVDFASMGPFLALIIGASVILLMEAFNTKKSEPYYLPVALLTLFISIWASIAAPKSLNPLLTAWLSFDSLSQFLNVFFLLIGMATACLFDSFQKKFKTSLGEFYFLLLAATFGLLMIGSSANFLTLFLGLETLSIPLYVLCTYVKVWDLSQESSIKYFLIGSIGAAFLLYGIALIYGATGTTDLSQLASAYHGMKANSSHYLFLGGVAFLTLGLMMKAAIFPMHFWAPDAYDGAPSPVTAFMAVGTKVGAFAALTRVFLVALPHFDPIWNDAIVLLAYPTLIFANIVALRQVQLRRFVAYSGISHAGFLLIPFAAGSPDAIPSLLFYLVVYAASTFGVFAVLAFLDRNSQGVMLTDLYGLFYRSPWLAGCLSLSLLTLAGIPPTAGFFAKFYLFKIAFQAGFHTLVIVALLTAILSAYYYLRIAAILFIENPDETSKMEITWSATLLGLVSVAVIAILSIYPTPLLSFLLAMVR